MTPVLAVSRRPLLVVAGYLGRLPHSRGYRANGCGDAAAYTDAAEIGITGRLIGILAGLDDLLLGHAVVHGHLLDQRGDLLRGIARVERRLHGGVAAAARVAVLEVVEIGRASCRERGWLSEVSISVVETKR